MSKINSIIEVNEIFIDIMRMIPNSNCYEYLTDYDSFGNDYSIWIRSEEGKIILEYSPYYFSNPYRIRWFINKPSEPPYKKEFKTKQELMAEFIKWIKVFPNPPE